MHLLLRLLMLAVSIICTHSAPSSTQQVLRTHDDPYIPSQAMFGVGFDLTASYGSAAVSFTNGTIITITKVAASDAYNELLARLSLESSQHPSPPYDNLGETWDDMPRQYLRKARKAVGLPASSDVGILADMLSQLRTSVEAQVGPIISAAITIPHLVALYYEDLHDACEYLGLEYIDFYAGLSGHHMLYETSAAYAGYGFGLCPSYEDTAACKEEQQAMPDTVVMVILYTRTALTVSLSIVGTAYSLWEPSYRHLEDFELGLDMKNVANEDEYWGKVRMRLGQIMVENPFYDRPAGVLLMGECVADETFQRQLLEVLGNQIEDLPAIFGSDSDLVAARGIAELAKRQPFKSK